MSDGVMIALIVQGAAIAGLCVSEIFKLIREIRKDRRDEAARKIAGDERQTIMVNQDKMAKDLEVNTSITAHALEQAATAAGRNVPDVLKDSKNRTQKILDEYKREYGEGKQGR